MKIKMTKQQVENGLKVSVSIISDYIAEMRWRKAGDHSLYAQGKLSAYSDRGVFDESEQKLWAHRIKYGKMDLTKEELETWLD